MVGDTGAAPGPEAFAQRIRWLIVDENPLMRTALPRVLELRGYPCASAGTADHALELARSFAPDVIVLEWVFRDGKGIGLARRLRTAAMEHGRRVIVLALSALDEPVGLRTAEQLDDYFVKPTSLSELLASVVRLQ